MKFGIRFETNKKRYVIAIDPEYFSWTPGEIESGSSSPGEYFNCASDCHILYGWLGITFFYGSVIIP